MENSWWQGQRTFGWKWYYCDCPLFHASIHQIVELGHSCKCTRKVIILVFALGDHQQINHISNIYPAFQSCYFCIWGVPHFVRKSKLDLHTTFFQPLQGVKSCTFLWKKIVSVLKKCYIPMIIIIIIIAFISPTPQDLFYESQSQSMGRKVNPKCELARIQRKWKRDGFQKSMFINNY